MSGECEKCGNHCIECACIEKLINYDKCGSKIEDGRCSCGYWYEKGKEPPFSKCLEAAIQAFNFQYDQNNMHIFSGDHFSGTSFILFKGDYKMCMKVCDYVEELIKNDR